MAHTGFRVAGVGGLGLEHQFSATPKPRKGE